MHYLVNRRWLYFLTVVPKTFIQNWAMFPHYLHLNTSLGTLLGLPLADKLSFEFSAGLNKIFLLLNLKQDLKHLFENRAGNNIPPLKMSSEFEIKILHT